MANQYQSAADVVAVAVRQKVEASLTPYRDTDCRLQSNIAIFLLECVQWQIKLYSIKANT